MCDHVNRLCRITCLVQCLFGIESQLLTELSSTLRGCWGVVCVQQMQSTMASHAEIKRFSSVRDPFDSADYSPVDIEILKHLTDNGKCNTLSSSCPKVRILADLLLEFVFASCTYSWMLIGICDACIFKFLASIGIWGWAVRESSAPGLQSVLQQVCLLFSFYWEYGGQTIRSIGVICFNITRHWYLRVMAVLWFCAFLAWLWEHAFL